MIPPVESTLFWETVDRVWKSSGSRTKKKLSVSWLECLGITFHTPDRTISQIREDYREGMTLIRRIFTTIILPVEPLSEASFTQFLLGKMTNDCFRLFQADSAAHHAPLEINEELLMLLEQEEEDINLNPEQLAALMGESDAFLQETPSVARSGVYLMVIWWQVFLPAILKTLHLLSKSLDEEMKKHTKTIENLTI